MKEFKELVLTDIKKDGETVEVIYSINTNDFINFFSNRDYRDGGKDFLKRLEDDLVGKLSAELYEKIYEEVLGKINIESIAKATSVRMIQKFSSQ